MLKDDELYLSHMLETARKAANKVRGISRAVYDEDENLHLALAHLVQILGEAARHVYVPHGTALSRMQLWQCQASYRLHGEQR
jgi:uncharacterized protein with HEPN domain